jgi:hypothetical protein
MKWSMRVLVLLLTALVAVSCGRRGAPRLHEPGEINSVNKAGQGEPVVGKDDTGPSDIERVDR